MSADQAYQDYQNGMKYQDIADKYGVTLNTVKSWKQRYNWRRDKKDAHDKKSVHTKNKGAPYVGNSNAAGHGAPKGNQNALGNNGGPPLGSHNAVTHGLYAKYIPPETLEIIANMGYRSPLDILWEAITIKYAAIIRAQKIMYVADASDNTEILKSASMSVDPKTGQKKSESRVYDITLAADKQAAFLTAQSKAMTTLNNMIKQYEDMRPDGEAALRIKKLKAELEPPGSAMQDDGFLDAIKASTKDVWSND